MYKDNILTDEGVFKIIFENAYNGFAIVGLEGAWIKVNESICEMLGYTENELYATNFQKLTHPDDLGNDMVNLNKLLSGEIDSYQIEKRYIHKEGDTVWGLLSVSLVRDTLNKPLYFVSQINNITKRKKIEADKTELTAIMKQKNKRLTSFAQIVTHNLRTHSANLCLIRDFIKQKDPDFATTQSFSLLKQSIDELKDTVVDLSELSQISKQREQDLKKLHLKNHVQRCLNSINALILIANAEIRSNIAPKIHIKGVASYVDSIMLNILTNAIKYRSKSRPLIIELSTEIKEDTVVLKIKDNGIGIDMKRNADKLFGLYNTFTDHEDSRGVGLYITRAQIESIGGNISVKSKLDEGTEFLLKFAKA